MSLIPYPGALTGEITDKIGERLSIFDFGDRTKLGRGNDDSVALQAAVDAIQTTRYSGGAEIYLPSGYVFGLASPVTVPVNSPPITLVGDGNASVIRRLADMPAGQGMINIKSLSGFRMAGLQIDGTTTVSQGLRYNMDFLGTGGNDPMHPSLTKNTSIWVHPGAAGILLENLKITHTGGYSILLDATTGPIVDVDLIRLWIDNNRPHLFGVTSGQLNYGSWTGGIHCQGDGRNMSQPYVVKRLQVALCRFTRNTGNCVWQHLYGLNTLHEHLKVVNNIFEDCGLDAILVGGVENGQIAENSIRRVGYITEDDGSQSVPQWLNGAWGVGIDTSGVAVSVNYVNNSLTSCNGGYIDADGYAKGTIAGNTLRTPSPDDPEYLEDQIGIIGWAGSSTPGGKNYAYGIQVSDTSGNLGGATAKISANNCINLCGGSILIFGGHNCVVSDNAIVAPPNSVKAPIILGNLGTTDALRSFENIVHANQIVYNPTSPTDAGTMSCVWEDSNFVLTPGDRDFASTDRNWVFGNILSEGSFEFQKDTKSNSTTEVRFSSNANNMSSASYHAVRREGIGILSALKWYFTDAASGVSGLQSMQLQGYGRSGANPNPMNVAEPLLNLSAAGSGGIYATGPRTTSALSDAMLTGKVYLDSFLAFSDTTFGNETPNPDADALPGTVALLRWSNALGRWRQSVTATGSVRQWTDFVAGGGGSVSGIGLDKEVIFNASGALIGSTNFEWDNMLQRLAVVGVSGTAGIVTVNSYIQTDEGFYTTSPAVNAIQAPAGGFYAQTLILTKNVTVLPPLTGVLSNTLAHFGNADGVNAAALVLDAFGGGVNITFRRANGTNASPSALLNGDGIGALAFFGYGASAYSSTTRALIAGFAGQNWNNTANATYVSVFTTPLGSTTAAEVLRIGSQGVLYIGGFVDNGTGALIQLTGFMSSTVGYYTPSTSYQAINALTGGVNANSFAAVAYTQVGQSSGDIDSGGGAASHTPGDTLRDGTLYYNTTTHALMVRSSGAFIALATGGSGAAGADTQVQYKFASVFAASANFTYDPTLQRLAIIGIATTAGIGVANGFISADGGFVVPNINSAPYNNFDVIQAKTGGVTVKYLIGSTSLTLLGETQANAGLSTNSGVGSGRIIFDTAQRHFYISENGNAYVQLAGTGPAGSANWVQYNNGSGSFAASTNFTYDPTLQRLAVTGIINTAAIAAVNGFVTSDGGFLVPNINSAPYNSSDVIQAKAGGVTALSLISIRNDGASGVTIARTSATAHTYGLGVSSGGVFQINDDTLAAARVRIGTSGIVALGTGFISGRSDQVMVQAPGASIAFQSTAGTGQSGIVLVDDSAVVASYAVYINSGSSFFPNTFFIAATATGAPIVLATVSAERMRIAANGEVQITSGQITISPSASAINVVNGAVYYSNSLNTFQFRQNSAWVTLGGGVASVQGTAAQVLVNGTSGVAQTGVLTLALPTNVTITGEFSSTLPSGTAFSANGGLFAAFANGNIACSLLNVNSQLTINGSGNIATNGSFAIASSLTIDTSGNVLSAGHSIFTGYHQSTGSSVQPAFYGAGTNSYYDTAYNASPGPYRLRGAAIVDNVGTWIGNGANCNAGAAFSGYNIFGGSAFGQTVTSGSFTSQTFTGGILTNFSTVSDGRLKNILEPYAYGLAEVVKLRPVMYEWNATALEKYQMKQTVRIGLIAQEVQKVMPKAVFTERFGYLGYDPDAVIAALVNSVQDLKKELEVLRSGIIKSM